MGGLAFRRLRSSVSIQKYKNALALLGKIQNIGWQRRYRVMHILNELPVLIMPDSVVVRIDSPGGPIGFNAP